MHSKDQLKVGKQIVHAHMVPSLFLLTSTIITIPAMYVQGGGLVITTRQTEKETLISFWRNRFARIKTIKRTRKHANCIQATKV